MATRGMLISLTLLVSIGTSMVSQEAAALTMRLIELGTLGGFGGMSEGSNVNNFGQVTGWTNTESSEYRAFVYSSGGMVELPNLLGGTSFGSGINDLGCVVGTEYRGLVTRGFLYDGTTVQALDILGGGNSSARDVNNSGQIVGYTHTGGFVYDGVTMSNLGRIASMAINSLGQVAGTIGSHVALFDRGLIEDLGTLGGSWAAAYDLNDLGQIVGESDTGSYLDPRRAFIYDGAGMRSLGTLGGDYSGAFGINNLGQVVGISDTATPGVTHAFLYDERLGGMVDLNEYVDPNDLAGWTLVQANAISDTGYITGYGDHNGFHRAFLLAPVPEPASGFLLAMGTGFLALRRRKAPLGNRARQS